MPPIRRYRFFGIMVASGSLVLSSLQAAESSAAQLTALGLVNVRTLDSTLEVALAYATTDNFMNRAVYGDLCDCFLQPEVAHKLVAAHRHLTRTHPHLRFSIRDCARPLSVQRIMWQIVKDTPARRYVASPSGHSVHNYGAAVDLTLIDTTGTELDMGTPYDFFGIRSQPRHEDSLYQCKELTAQQLANRRLLRRTMQQAGFLMIRNEWWHFEALRRDSARVRWPLIE